MTAPVEKTSVSTLARRAREASRLLARLSACGDPYQLELAVQPFFAALWVFGPLI
jgi:hypothetical protein